MTQQEHLNRIRARCMELLELYSHTPCAGVAEAGWKATITAIDRALVILEFHTTRPIGVVQLTELETAEDFANSIIASWPTELL